jgi:hypothetical protein
LSKSPPHQCHLWVWKTKMYCRSCEVFLKLLIHTGTMLHVLVRQRWVTYFGSLPHVQLTCQNTVTWYRWDCYLMNQAVERHLFAWTVPWLLPHFHMFYLNLSYRNVPKHNIEWKAQ